MPKIVTCRIKNPVTQFGMFLDDLAFTFLLQEIQMRTLQIASRLAFEALGGEDRRPQDPFSVLG
jgi:hypothetical protein